MAETMKKESPIENAVASAGQRLAQTKKTLKEGLIHCSSSHAFMYEAEQNFDNAYLTLATLNTRIAGLGGFKQAKDMLQECIEGIKRDVKELRLARERVSGYKNRSDAVLGDLRAHSISMVETVFGDALQKRKAPAGSYRIDLRFDEPEAEVVVPELTLKPIVVHEASDAPMGSGLDTDMEPLKVAVSLLEESGEYAAHARQRLGFASTMLEKARLNYAGIRDSIEGGDKMPRLTSAKAGISAIVNDMEAEKGLLAGLGSKIDEAITDVLRTMRDCMGEAYARALDPKGAGVFSMEEPEETKGPDPAGGGTGPASGGASAGGATSTQAPGTAQKTPLESCLAGIENRNPDAAVEYFKVHGDQNAKAVFGCLENYGLKSEIEAQELVGTLARLAADSECPTSVCVAALEFSRRIYQNCGVEVVVAKVSQAFPDFAAAEAGSIKPLEIDEALSLGRCLEAISKGTTDAALDHFREYGDLREGSVFAQLATYGSKGQKEGLDVVGTLAAVKNGPYAEPITQMAGDVLYGISQDHADAEVKAAAGRAYHEPPSTGPRE